MEPRVYPEPNEPRGDQPPPGGWPRDDVVRSFESLSVLWNEGLSHSLDGAPRFDAMRQLSAPSSPPLTLRKFIQTQSFP